MEHQYLNLLKLCLNSKPRKTRNSIVYSTFAHRIEHDFENGFPLITTKKVYFKAIVEELAWFLRGSTDVNELRKKNVHIWDMNTEHRNYDAGPIYGFQWRHFGAKYTNSKDDYTDKGIDQIENILKLIKNNPMSRRMLLSAWNPVAQPYMSLPPCHVNYQFYVENGKLSCQMYQRSADIFLGLPFNIASTGLLLCLMAHETDLKPGKLTICLGDVHLYENHKEVAISQLKRIPKTLPTIEIKRKKDGLHNVQIEQVLILNYNSYNKLKATMVK